MKICTKCGKEKETDCFYKRTKVLSSWCRECFNTAIKARFRLRKVEMIAHMGGRCQHCGYSKCVSALEIHHKDPAKKSATWVRMKGWSWDRLLVELADCVLLCANCHREEEEKIFFVECRC
jgi:hypothetical protein